MHKIVKIVITAAVASAVVAGGVAVTLADPTDVPKPEKQNTEAQHAHKRAPLAAIDTSTAARFTAIEPCRIANTVTTGAKIAKNATRAFKVLGTNLSSQGGSSTGCGIPAAATGVATGIVTTHSSANGVLRFAPYNVAPTFGLMYHTKDPASGQPVIPLGTGTTYAFNIKSADAATDVTISATGYYIKPMFAYVGAGGTLIQSSRVTTLVNHANGTGVYYVFFDRDVTGCAYNATAYLYGYVTNVEEGGPVNAVYVHIEDSATHDDEDAAFYLTVSC